MKRLKHRFTAGEWSYALWSVPGGHLQVRLSEETREADLEHGEASYLITCDHAFTVERRGQVMPRRVFRFCAVSPAQTAQKIILGDWFDHHDLERLQRFCREQLYWLDFDLDADDIAIICCKHERSEEEQITLCGPSYRIYAREERDSEGRPYYWLTFDYEATGKEDVHAAE